MNSINIIVCSKLKDSYPKEMISDYKKRVKGFVNLELFEVSNEKQLNKLITNLKGSKSSFTICLDEKGKSLDSIEFSKEIQNQLEFSKNINIIIGESTGLPEKIVELGDKFISISNMTLSFHICTIMIIEQIYRSCTIIQGHPYHKQ